MYGYYLIQAKQNKSNINTVIDINIYTAISNNLT